MPNAQRTNFKLLICFTPQSVNGISFCYVGTALALGSAQVDQ
jgi:hypothetical protein